MIPKPFAPTEHLYGTLIVLFLISVFLSGALSQCLYDAQETVPSIQSVKNTDRSGEFYEHLGKCKVTLESVGCSSEIILNRIKDKPLSSRVKVPDVGRKRFLTMTLEEETKMGQLYLEHIKKGNFFYDDPTQMARVKKVAEALHAVLPRKFPLNIYLVDIPSVNAFCLYDGTILITRGALKTFTNDHQLASILAHEMGHAIARHAGESITKNTLREFALIKAQGLTEVAIDKSDMSIEKKTITKLGVDILGGVIHLGSFLHYSRKNEYEADFLSLIYMKRAGFNLNGAVEAMEKFAATENGGLFGDMLSTHPAAKKRLKRIKEHIEVLQDAAKAEKKSPANEDEDEEDDDDDDGEEDGEEKAEDKNPKKRFRFFKKKGDAEADKDKQ